MIASTSSDLNSKNNQLETIDKLLGLEIRIIESYKLTKISEFIDPAKSWSKLLNKLTLPIIRNINNQNYNYVALKLSPEALYKIEQQFQCCQSPTLALLTYWSITGRRRPTVGCLLFYLHACNLKRAEEEVCRSILGLESINQILPYYYPEASIEALPSLTSDDFELDDQYKFDNLDQLDEGLKAKYPKYSFKEIYMSTNRFCHKPFNRNYNSGTKIGEGRFSSVYRANTRLINDENSALQIVAAKLLKSECNSKYLANEINLIGNVKHENILELLGLAFGGSTESENFNHKYLCLIYPFMENGSLLDCLSYGLPTKSMEFITWTDRLNILVKIARGISYLHTLPTGPLIHRDIKTANILLDENIQPKVGDFTLVRQVQDTMHATGTQFSQSIVGTSVYMPPEAFRGDISIKFDTFSYGIVLLELLTGMRPFNEKQDGDLFTYINEQLSDIDEEFDKQTNSVYSIEDLKDTFLMSILDKKAGECNFAKCKLLFNLSLKATESRKKDRPEMTSILSSLEKIISI